MTPDTRRQRNSQLIHSLFTAYSQHIHLARRVAKVDVPEGDLVSHFDRRIEGGLTLEVTGVHQALIIAALDR